MIRKGNLLRKVQNFPKEIRLDNLHKLILYNGNFSEYQSENL